MTAADAFPAGHPLRFTTIAHADRTILGPHTADELEALLDAVPLPAGSRAVDIGCGKGDLLVRLARRGATGIGIDRNGAFLADAQRLAARAGVADRLRFALADAGTTELDGDVDVVVCIGATGALGGPALAPVRLAALARRGGSLLIGEGFWRRDPTPSQLADFGVEPGELLDLDGTLARMADAGLELLASQPASLAGWDAYEESYAGAAERWAAANPGDPDRDDVLARAAWFRATWGAWRRDAMGFVTAVLRVR